mmetsp:Transcript_13889/g.32290  ORF Transcript_13889/g.32290 Transcript_13889/m.32290 type:complete len:210 (-) Transcript_13889:48-677(-)
MNVLHTAQRDLKKEGTKTMYTPSNFIGRHFSPLRPILSNSGLNSPSVNPFADVITTTLPEMPVSGSSRAAWSTYHIARTISTAPAVFLLRTATLIMSTCRPCLSLAPGTSFMYPRSRAVRSRAAEKGSPAASSKILSRNSQYRRYLAAAAETLKSSVRRKRARKASPMYLGSARQCACAGVAVSSSRSAFRLFDSSSGVSSSGGGTPAK